MKIFFCIFVSALCIVHQSVAQDYIPTAAEIRHFSQTKTMMILEDNPICEYNLALKELVPNEWTATPHDFLVWKNFESQRRDKSLSFLILNKVTFEKDKSNARYQFMSLLLGGNAKSLSDMPDLCSVPLAYYDAPEESYIYKIGIFLRFIQNHVKAITADPSIASKNIMEHYNKNIQKLSGKTLYLIADELARDVNTEAKIKAVYDGPFKLVTAEDIQKAIADKNPNVVFLHKVGPGKNQTNSRCFKILVGADDAQFYYFDYHKIDSRSPDGFLASDFKKLSRRN